MITLEAAFTELPLLAILRGVEPSEALDVASVLTGAGFRIIEIPLNSPDAVASIRMLAESIGHGILIGAGTVMTPDDVRRVADAGGRLIVMPHGDPEIIRAAKDRGLACIPGVATPTEAFAALADGADGLKMFPAEAMPPAVVKAWRAVIGRPVRLIPVGGITPETMQEYVANGASGFGLGSALFRPGLSLADLGANARAFVDAVRAVR